MTQERDRNCPPHEKSGVVCMVRHENGRACHVCAKCGRYIRPENMEMPVEVKICPKCNVNEATIWSSPDVVANELAGWFCDDCHRELLKVMNSSP
jgi:Zn finger protein HypA/HybF involved in hydrogenase expression